MRRIAFLFLIVLSFILAFSLQGVRGIWQPDESYYVGVAVQMNHENQCLIPKLNEEVFLDKPAMLYWGIVGGIKLFGQSEFAVRIFSGLCFALTVLTVFELGRSLSSRFSEGFWAAIIYATMIIPFFAADFVTPDTPLTLFTTLAMLAFWRSLRPDAKYPNLWKMILCLAVGLGFLTKGPAAIIPCGAMFIFLLISGKLFRYFWTPWAVAGFILFLITGLGWYTYISLKLPGAAAYFFDSMIWGRLVSDKYQRNPGLGGGIIYLPILLLGTLPWSVLWYDSQRGLRGYFSTTAWKELPKDPARLLLACWIIIPMAVLCLASSKLGLYAMPIFPALALATAKLLPETIPSGSTEQLFSRVAMKRISFLLLWTGLLLVSRLIFAAVPSANDCRALWKELTPYLPKGDYEIAAVDERVDGLSFYGAMEVENVTRRTKPYPTYTSMESVEAESEDMLVDKFPHLFIIQGQKHLPALEKALSKPNWSIRRVELQYDRWLLICSPLAP
ncbi:MAG: glycosyltransferase family 39 protein [Planctomycetes bacterium]|nr:glycosyltransferase family 39 protein [Planctomycetota bacterium]